MEVVLVEEVLVVAEALLGVWVGLPVDDRSRVPAASVEATATGLAESVGVGVVDVGTVPGGG